MIIQTIDTASQFRDAFHRCGRGDQFSYDGFKALFDYLEELTEGCEPLELDPIALCCEFSEYTLEELKTQYLDDCADDEIIDYLQDHTHLIKVTNETYIVAAFQE